MHEQPHVARAISASAHPHYTTARRYWSERFNATVRLHHQYTSQTEHTVTSFQMKCLYGYLRASELITVIIKTVIIRNVNKKSA